MIFRQIAAQDRIDAYDQERKQRGDGEDHLELRGLQNAAVLNGERRKQNDGADEEGRVDAQRQAAREPAEIEQGDLPGVDGGRGREQHVQHVACAHAGADGQHRRPCEPVAPDRERCEQLAVADPGDGAVDGGATRLVRKEPRDFCIREGLDEAESDREHPDDPRRLADSRRDRTDREKYERRNTARYPEGACPTYLSMQARNFSLESR
jgi:hypothetical protein